MQHFKLDVCTHTLLLYTTCLAHDAAWASTLLYALRRGSPSNFIGRICAVCELSVEHVVVSGRYLKRNLTHTHRCTYRLGHKELEMVLNCL
eukprot:4727297-Amphidinium_carterae.2